MRLMEGHVLVFQLIRKIYFHITVFESTTKIKIEDDIRIDEHNVGEYIVHVPNVDVDYPTSDFQDDESKILVKRVAPKFELPKQFAEDVSLDRVSDVTFKNLDAIEWTSAVTVHTSGSRKKFSQSMDNFYERQPPICCW